MRSNSVAVRRSSTEVATFRCHRLHRGPHPHAEPVALGPTESAEHRHEEIVRLGVGIDRATDFGHPQLHAPVGQLGEDVLHLTGGAEGSLWFADDDAGPAAIRVGELAK